MKCFENDGEVRTVTVERGVKKKSSSHGSDNDLARSLSGSGKAHPRAQGSERRVSPRALVVVSLDEC